jgi:hypothetical protein
MVKKSVFIVSLFFMLLGIAHSQERSPFDSLAAGLESKFGVKLFYDKSHTDGLSIPSSSGSLEEILRSTLEGTGLSFHRDAKSRVFIYRGDPIPLVLSPDYFNPDRTSKIPDTSKIISKGSVTEMSGNENKIQVIGKKGGEGLNAVLSGYVRDGANGEPLNSASVTVEGKSGGVSTDAFGFFSITVPKGNQTLKVSSIGMKDISRQLNVLGNGRLDVEMLEEVRSLKTAVVVGQKQSNVRGMQMGVERLSIRSIKQIPAVMGETDILRSLLTLPGITSVGEGTVGYNVRGGAADQNLVLLNDMTIFNPTHLFGFFSAVDPEVVRGFDLYKSAVPERLGGRISSIMEVNTRDGNTKKLTGTAGIGPLTSKFTLEGPIKTEKTTFLAGGRTTYSNWFLKQLPDETFRNSKVNFNDLLLHFSHVFSDRDRIYLSGYVSDDTFKLNEDSTYSYNNRNFRIKWKHDFSDKLYNVLSAGMDEYMYSVKGRSNPKNAFDLGFGLRQWSVKSDFKYSPDNKHDINFGVQHLIYDLQPGKLRPADAASIVTAQTMSPEKASESSVYLGDQFRVSSKISLQAGIRYSYYRFLGPGKSYIYDPLQPRSASSVTDSVEYDKNQTIQTYHGPEIRVSARYMLGTRSSFKISYNTLRQYIHMITNTTAISPTDIWKLSDPYIKPQIGQQVSLGFYSQVGEKGVEVSAEAYYKTTKHYLDYKSGAQLVLNDHLERDVMNTNGKAYGIELLLKKPVGKLNGWISYTYLRTFLKVDDPIAGEIINKGNAYPANFDKPHIASLVANYRFTQRFSISLTSTYSTGRPITYPVGTFNMGGSTRVLYSERNAFRIPDFFRTDFSMNIENNHNIKQKLHTSWTLGVYNITGRDNPYSVYFIVEDRKIKAYQLSVFASAIPFVTFNLKF